MTGKPRLDPAEKLRAKLYREASEDWTESERRRLANIFSTLGTVESSISLCFEYDKFSTLEDVRKSVEAGDRTAMLALLHTVTSALQAFEVLPKDVREALAAGLENMRGQLEQSNNFLPRRRGRKPAEILAGEFVNAGFKTAMQVEFMRLSEHWTLLEAKQRASEELGITESLVNKRWKQYHKQAKGVLQSAIDVQAAVRAALVNQEKVPK